MFLLDEEIIDEEVGSLDGLDVSDYMDSENTLGKYDDLFGLFGFDENVSERDLLYGCCL